jgi:oligosaccharide repeat unit polymerase
MFVPISILIILVVIVVINNKFEKSILYPPFIFSSIWVLVIFIYVIFKIIDPGEMDKLHNKTLLFLAVSNILFSLGGIYTLYYMNKKPSRIIFIPSKIPEIIGDVIIIITLVTLILVFFKAKELASEVEAQNFFIALRYQLTSVRHTYGVLDYFLSFGLFASLYRLLTFEKFSDLGFKRITKLIVSMIITFGFLVLSTGRTYFFFYMITALIIIYLKGRVRVRYIVGFFLSALILFIFIGVILNKGGNMENSFRMNINSSLNHLLAYFEGPLLAFDRFLNSEISHTYGENTFRFFIALLYDLNLSDKPPIDIVNKWIMVPYPTNVYTIFYQYFMDFGILGCWIVIFLFGLVHTWMFYRAKTSGNHFKMITAYTFYPLLMVFFQDQYFSLLSFWIQLWFYSFMIFILIDKYGIRKRIVT